MLYWMVLCSRDDYSIALFANAFDKLDHRTFQVASALQPSLLKNCFERILARCIDTLLSSNIQWVAYSLSILHSSGLGFWRSWLSWICNGALATLCRSAGSIHIYGRICGWTRPIYKVFHTTSMRMHGGRSHNVRHQLNGSGLRWVSNEKVCNYSK